MYDSRAWHRTSSPVKAVSSGPQLWVWSGSMIPDDDDGDEGGDADDGDGGIYDDGDHDADDDP